MYAFSSAVQRWLPLRERRDAPLSLESFSLLTWNIWFDEHAFGVRRDAAIALIEDACPDFIVLQEVTKPFLDGLLASDVIRESFTISLNQMPKDKRYEAVVLSQLPIRSASVQALTSTMGRNVCLVDIAAREPLVIAGTHLESGRELASARLVQIEESARVLGGYPQVIWAGDFNCDAGSAEDELIARLGFVDAWSTLHQEPGLTRDSERNTMLATLGQTKATRIDHIYVKGAFRPTRVSLVGTEPIAPDLFPSDHFGLLASFTREPQV